MWGVTQPQVEYPIGIGEYLSVSAGDGRCVAFCCPNATCFFRGTSADRQLCAVALQSKHLDNGMAP
jgi:hypothetical protein